MDIYYPTNKPGRPSNEDVAEAIAQARADGHRVVGWTKMRDEDGTWLVHVIAVGGTK